jgi:hypothetical protein
MSAFSEELRKYQDEQGVAPAPRAVQQAVQVAPAAQPAPPQGTNELFIKGAIIGVALFFVWALFAGGKALLNAKSEGGKRLKIVVGVGLATFFIYGAAVTGTLPGLAALAGVIGAGVWITKGFAKK